MSKNFGLLNDSDLYFYNIFHLSHIYFQVFLYKYNRSFHFHIIPAALLTITSFFLFLRLIISIAYSLMDSQNFFKQFLPLYTSSLFSMPLIDNIVDIENPDGICSFTFVVD